MSDLLAAIPRWLILALIFLAMIWLLMAILVLWDATRRRLSRQQRLQWLLLAFVPLVGPLLYLMNRPSPAESDSGRRFTALKPPDMSKDKRLPTILAADLIRQENPRPAAPMPRATYRLLASEGPHRGTTYNLGSLPALIGRDLDCTIRLDNDHGVSRHHAELYQAAGQDGRLHLKDLGSTHGTFVNGHQIQDTPLTPGDKLLLGHSLLILEK